jgi:flagellar biosynthetic protein FlhB
MATETPRYEPTPRKLAEIRRHGGVPRSRELSGALVLLIGLLFLWFAFDPLIAALKENFTLVFAAIENDSSSPLAVMQTCVFRCAFVLAPFIVLVFAVGFAASLLQVGPMFSPQAIFPRPSVFDPMSRLSRLFSGWQALEFLLALLKLSVVGWIVWITLEDGMRGVLDSMRSGLQSSMISIGKLTVALWFRIMVALLIFAVGDLFYQRYRFRQSQKMTHEELLREQREIYGDPLVRQRRGRIYREVVAHATLEETAKATVVIHGESQVAVALRYRPDDHEGRAPEIIAKGASVLAQRILHTATLYSIPTVPDSRLTMALYQLEVGREIPRDLYTEVAAALRSVRAA